MPASSQGAIVVHTLSVPLGPDGEVFAAWEPDVAVDAEGNVTATWAYDCYDPYNQGPVECMVQARSWSSAGALSDIVNLSVPESGGFQRVAVDDQGRFLIHWPGRSSTPGTGGLLARVRAADGSWSSEEVICPCSNGPRGMAMDSQGGAVFVWNQSSGFPLYLGRIQARARSAGGTLSTVQDVSPPSPDVWGPKVAVAGDGDALVVWELRGTTGRIQARARAADGSLSGIENLSPAGVKADAPQVAMTPDGRALVVWETGRLDAEDEHLIQARFRSAAGVWSEVETLTRNAGGMGGWGPQLAMDADGRALVVWVAPERGGLGSGLRARARSATGSWSAVETISLPSAGDIANDPKVAMDGDGRAFVVWIHEPIYGFHTPVRIRTRWPGGTWSAVRNLSGPGASANWAQVDANPSGRAAIVWEDFGTYLDPEGFRAIRGAALAAEDLPPDTIPPETKITAGPAGQTTRRKVTFRFSASQAGSTFQCKRDSSAWRTCASPKTYLSLAFGRHVFWVRAIDPSRNTDPTPAKRVFRIVRS